MRVRACLAVAILLATAMVGGASQHAGAATNGPARALHCSAGPPFYFPYNYVYAFVGSGSGSTNGTSLYSCFSTATVTAIPAEDWKFKDWTGTCAGQGASCSVFVAHSYYEDGPIYQSWANFERLRATVTVQRSGNGTIRSDPGGIDCGNTCSAEFDQGSQVALDAIAPAGVQFNGWGGACANAQQNVRCVIGVPAGGATVTASFGPPPVQLTVSKTGNGTVTSSPAGISCGATCSGTFPSGTRVTLTETPDADHPFQGWGGACSGTATTCAMTLTAATAVQARFAQGKVDGLGATFQGTWKRSLYSGSLSVTGTATKDAQLTATISSVSALRAPQSRSIQQTFQFSVGTGAFNKSFQLPAAGFFPGRYTVQLTGTIGGAPILGRSAALAMAAPKEGVVSRAWITLGKGKEVTRAPRGSKRLVANFVYAAKPYIGSKVTVSWFLGKKALGTVKKIRWKPIVVTDVASPAGLPSGRYTCVLKARGLVVYEVAIRVD